MPAFQAILCFPMGPASRIVSSALVPEARARMPHGGFSVEVMGDVLRIRAHGDTASNLRAVISTVFRLTRLAKESMETLNSSHS